MLLLLMVCCTTYAMASAVDLFASFGVASMVWFILSIFGVK